MEEEQKKACKIAAQALEYALTLIVPDTTLLEICEKTEKKIQDLGAKPAFPVQISLNDTAAHFCPDEDDTTVLKDQVVCIDIGVHIKGYIGDNAATIDLSKNNQDLVKASREALDNAIKIIKPGITLAEIGKTIQETIQKYGFAPVRNLSGHGLDEYNIHTKPTIPNYDNGDTTKLEEGMIVAIEPFASKGAGIVYESGNPTVFSLAGKKPTRNIITRKILKEIDSYNGLPFCKRWLTHKFGFAKTSLALRDLKQLEILREYPPLIDKNHGLVSQAEHTVLVTKEGCEILTKA
ncbi:type II methionyl aminopeptidase [Candidatus Woesearchaeota archaeon]|nr:type II methionyl aminopeptidase [Candidatus Woesearchaeota archaeon]